MLVQLVRFFRGYVDFTANGKFPERFLNITSRYGINLWNAQPSKHSINASMYISDYRKIRLAAKKSGVKTRIKSKHGLPFFVNKYKPRIGIPIGAAAGVILIIVLSNFIWSVSITGAQTVSETKIKQVLSENGVKTGSYKNNLDVQKIERDTMLEIDEIGWMSVNITGNIASIEIKEKAQKPKLDSSATPSNIKAKCDGVITNIKAKKGEVQVKKGSGVAKGDLLVSGIIETKMNTLQYVRANAEVFADVVYKKESSIKSEYEYTCLSGEKTYRNRAFLLWLEFPCSMSFSSYEKSVFSETSQNVICNDTVLPLGIKTSTQSDLISVEKTLTKSDAEKIFMNDLLLYEVFERPKSEVVGRKVNINKTGDEYHCETDYIFNENIAYSEEFSVTD
ncbi:sporulation protein YqfD [Ruminococcus sp.]|uniref:sporulation protein YqfD n=1 Tax=Ruminococcus sp. TaxID=41978 RepID=UPI002622DFF8|nr:sporulation protein YqfD [Ruminococcus sp.]MDD6988464.1 sporulation protein YqfD [Ruminococcus sp.]MDY6200777.1 sporulation protein YqfD [Ruminococcus sp.]